MATHSTEFPGTLPVACAAMCVVAVAVVCQVHVGNWRQSDRHTPDTVSNNRPDLVSAPSVKSLVRQLALQEIPANKGGGFSADTELCNVKEGDSSLDDLAKVPRVRSFYFNELSPDGWRKLGRLSDLESLECSSWFIKDEHLQCLQDLRHLERLVLGSAFWAPSVDGQPYPRGTHNKFTGESLTSLRHMRHLKQLVLYSDALTNDGLAQVGSARTLVSLKIVGSFSNEGLRKLAGLSHLKYLILDGEFDDAGLIHLAGLTSLENLVLKSDRITGTGLTSLRGVPRLRFLKFGPLSGASTLAPLREWQALEALNLADRGTTDPLLMTLGQVPSLKSLSLNGATISDDGLISLQGLTNLEELDLDHTDITDRGIAQIVRLQNLRLLVVGTSSSKRLITEMGLERLSQLPRLNDLRLTFMSLEGGDLLHLMIPSLKRIGVSIRSTQIDEDLRQLKAKLPNLHSTDARFYAEAYLANEPGFGEYDYLND